MTSPTYIGLDKWMLAALAHEGDPSIDQDYRPCACCGDDAYGTVDGRWLCDNCACDQVGSDEDEARTERDPEAYRLPKAWDYDRAWAESDDARDDAIDDYVPF